MNAFMILLALRLGGTGARFLRVLSGAAFGAAAAAIVRGQAVDHAAALWLFIAAGMVLIAAGRRACGRLLSHVLLLFSAGGLLGGVVLALRGASGSLFAAYLLAGGLTVWLLLRGMAGRCAGKLYIQCGGVRLAAVIDSGNTLRDYLTQLPVIVLPEGNPQAARMIAGLPQRLIFADTAGGRQMMRMAVPESITLSVNGRRKRIAAAAALAPALNVQSPALVPQALMDGERDQ